MTASGTACVETALCEGHDAPENRAQLFRQGRELGLMDAVEWVQDAALELVTCMIFGVRSDGSSANDEPDEG